MSQNRYDFRNVTLSDLRLLREWRAEPNVMRWWGTGVDITTEKLRDDRVARWIVSIDGRPFAYMQDYTVHGWDDHPFFDFPEGSRGIDQYIGVPEMIGRGHGPGWQAQG